MSPGVLRRLSRRQFLQTLAMSWMVNRKMSALARRFAYAPNSGGAVISPPPPTYPSRLHASGTRIVAANGYVMPTMKGFSAQIVPWSTGDFAAMAALAPNFNFVRTVCFWDAFEPTQGNISSGKITALDAQIANLQAAGMYTMLELHLNLGSSHWPTWAGTDYSIFGYLTYGQNVTQYLANRYGNPTSPQYTPAVIGFGLNEPPPDSRSSISNTIPMMEADQSTMISWFRTYAPEWIGFVALGYAQATPTYDTYTSSGNTAATPASATAYNAVGGNVIYDLHDYGIGTTSGVANDDGRQWNGMPYNISNGGQAIGTGDPSRPTFPFGETEALAISQMTAYVDPYKRFCKAAGIPLMIGEWGWDSVNTTGYNAMITDKVAIWDDAGAAIQCQWDYNTNQTQDSWAANPSGTFLPVTVTWAGLS